MKSVKQDEIFNECVELMEIVSKKSAACFTVGELAQIIKWKENPTVHFFFDTVHRCLKEYASRLKGSVLGFSTDKEISQLVNLMNDMGVNWTHTSAELGDEQDPQPPESYTQICVTGWQFVFNHQGNFLGMIDSRNPQRQEFIPKGQ